MKAMVMNEISDLRSNKKPLEWTDVPMPEPAEKELLLKVLTCGVCHTELDEIEGRTPPPRLPVIPGHQIVGQVEKTGGKVTRFKPGDRVGVAWIFSACGKCKFCLNGNENLCPDFKATGRDADGGYAEYMTVPEDFAVSIPDGFSDLEAAPLLCAGAIGYRSLKLTTVKDGGRLGLTGFGASGHLVLKMVRYKLPHTEVYVFARSPVEREFALQLGAVWAGETSESSPYKLDSIIDTTPVWKPVVEALRNLESGGRLVINAIRKEHTDQDWLLNLDYPRDLWMEKEIKSVANVERADVSEFLKLAAEIPIKPEVQSYSLEDANRALLEIKERKIRGAKVLEVSR
ncbi:MAG: zinc-dependent alcohol dehydrogenase family protein [Candidatus Aminicenantes bacterium]|nr:zinc-dependent alcohol dehydrogenase family protein [Candidatus Aminicenantes bacterium]